MSVAAGIDMRIGIKLDNTETNQTIWSEKFDASKEDLWDLEENLAASVAYQIVGQVEADEIRSGCGERKRHENAGAYDLVLKGLKNTIEMPAVLIRRIPRKLQRCLIKHWS